LATTRWVLAGVPVAGLQRLRVKAAKGGTRHIG
jgi:hypothetical protein